MTLPCGLVVCGKTCVQLVTATLCVCMCVCVLVRVPVCAWALAADGDWPGLLSFAEELVGEGEGDLTVGDVLGRSKEARGRSAIHFAANAGHAHVCRAIVDAGVRCVG